MIEWVGERGIIRVQNQSKFAMSHQRQPTQSLFQPSYALDFVLFAVPFFLVDLPPLLSPTDFDWSNLLLLIAGCIYNKYTIMIQIYNVHICKYMFVKHILSGAFFFSACICV